MVFTSYIFVFDFLPLVLAGDYALPARSTWRNAWLLIPCYVFYGWWNPWFVLLMLFVTVVGLGALLLCVRSQAHEWSESLTWPKALALAPTFARPQLLERTKVVVWEFVERDLRLGTEGWQTVPLPPTETPAQILRSG